MREYFPIDVITFMAMFGECAISAIALFLFCLINNKDKITQ